MTLTFTSIVNSNIFPDEFANLTTNNTIEFSKSGRLAVVYAPNGVGKTSFARTLRDGNKERPDIKYDCSPEKKFVVIEDQNGRDIIQGKAGEFFIGHDIVLADKMFAALDTMYNSICGEFAKYLKDVKITGKDSWIIGYLNRISKKFGAFTNALLNSRDKGKTEKYKTVYEILSDSNIRIGNESQDIDNRKYDFFVSHSAGVINELRIFYDKERKSKLTPVPEIRKYEAEEVAISVLKRFPTETTCVVCDTRNINSSSLLEKKEKNRDIIHSTLDEKTKNLLNDIISQIADDPFEIKKQVYDFLISGNPDDLQGLMRELEIYANEFVKRIINWFVKTIGERDSEEIEGLGRLRFTDLYTKYTELVSKDPELEDSEQMFLKEVISKSMGKQFKLEWKDGPHGKALQLFLDESELLNMSRADLHLSSGEQNFISIVFELLRARQSKDSIIVLDDPISSFDSVYKNKISFVILDIFRKSKENGNYGILLTHNTDLLRLLNAQMGHAYELYILSKIPGAMQGFIHVDGAEARMITDLSAITSFFRNEIKSDTICDEDMFLISMIPFVRGMASITGNDMVFSNLSKVMHGTQKDFADISGCYSNVFNGSGYSPSKDLELNSEDIISRCSAWNWTSHILKPERFWLLDHTLRHTMGYLYLRIKAEEVICRKFDIKPDDEKGTNNYLLFGNILSRMSDAGAKKYPDSSKKINEWKVQMMAMKTLVNEFNHFEGNLSIFQPAIDISDETLERERKSIEEILDEIEVL